MISKLKALRNEIISDVKPSENDEKEIEKKVDDFLKSLNSSLKKARINASAVIGGSFAKRTTIKKDKYDVDVFVVFDRKYDSEKISGILENILGQARIKFDRLPGSRDYFSIDYRSFKIEAVPVIKTAKPSEAKNITDLSLMHVDYIAKQIKKRKNLNDEIRLVKALCYANNCYGAESHIKGFSGYCIELLTSHYGSFESLVKNASKWKSKVIIDPAKYYKGKNPLAELNEAKTMSPLILIDPVQKDRNAAAALSVDKFNIFTDICRKFSANPSKRFFERKTIDEDAIIKRSKKEKTELYKIIAGSDKIKEDTAGSKLLKLFNLIKANLKKEGYNPKEQWEFRDKEAKMWFSIKPIKNSIKQGPPAGMKKYVAAFKKKYRKTFVKKGRICAYAKPIEIKDILSVDKKQLSEMGINYFKTIKIN